MPAILAGIVLIPVNSSMIAVGIPIIAHALSITVEQVVWVVSVYLIVMATVQPIAGKLGDTYGHRPLFLIGMGVFLVASVLAAESHALGTLILFRGLQGLGGALAGPNAVAIFRLVYPTDQLPRVLGLVSMVQGMGAAVGPLIGSLLISRFGWAAIFWLSVPVSLVSFLLGIWQIPREDRRERRPLDFSGALGLAGVLVLVTLLVGHGNTARDAWWLLIPVGLFFLWQERQAVEPVVRLGLFRIRPFLVANLGVLVNNFAMYTTLLWMPLYLRGLAFPISEVGPLLFGFSLAMSTASWLGGRLSQIVGRRAMVTAGFSLQGLSLVGFLLLVHDPNPSALLAFLVSAGAGTGLGTVSFQATSLQSVSRQEAGMASGIYSTFRYFGSILASALVGGLIGGWPTYAVSLGTAAILGLLIAIVFPGRHFSPGVGGQGVASAS